MTTVINTPAANLTYEAYLAEPQVEGRYDIIEGTRVFMSGATWQHQAISGNLYDLLRCYSRAHHSGTALYAPFDVLIRRVPRLQTRQPDLLFISQTRLAQAGGIPAASPLTAAPELVIEIISNSETQRILAGKLADYIAIGVDECWIVRADTHTVELLQPSRSGSQIAAVYDETQSLTSPAFPSLTISVADIFQP